MILFSVCEPCNVAQAYDGARMWGDFDKCEKCKRVMNVWTESGLQNENFRRRAAIPILAVKPA